MPKRVTVKSVNIPSVESYLGIKGWSNAFFCVSAMGKGRGWISEWKRGKNLPSIEEAAKMCAVLQARPDELLLDPDDIKEVQGALEGEAKKEPPAEVGEQFSPLDSRWFSLTEEEKLQAWEYIVQLRAKNQGGDKQ